MIYRRFQLNKNTLSVLSKKDQQIIEILSDVVKDAAELYRLQSEDGYYPLGVSKKEVEKSAAHNPSILSPYTQVFWEGDKLQAIPFHIKYTKILQPLAKRIEQAASLSTNPSFKKYLRVRAKSLVDGSYREADIAWLDVKNSRLDFTLGLFERYLDKLLFVKRAYQSFVGIVDKEMEKEADEIKEVLYASAKTSFDKSHSTYVPRKGVAIVIENTPATSGYLAEALFSGEHFPSDLDLMQQYGSKIVIYTDQLKLKFEQLHYPIFRQIFEQKFASKYSKELLLKATIWSVLLNQLARQLHKYIGSRERLKELFGPVDEANGYVSGVQHAKHLVVKGLISQDVLEAIIIVHIVRMFSDWLLSKESLATKSHVTGFSIALNYYLSSGALRESDGISWPNFPKVFFEIEELSGVLVHLLQAGSYPETDRFVKKWADLKIFDRLGKRIKNLNPHI